MISNVPARLLGGILCAAAALAFSAPSIAASDEPAQQTEDVSNDEEVRPPSSSEDMTEDRSSAPEEPSMRERDGAPDRSSAAPSEQPKPDREAAKRALLSDPKKDKPNPLLDTRGPDYYDRRAKELLKDDNDKGRVDLHPLMEAHPDSYVIVCTAGCRSGESAQIVSLLPKRNATPVPDATSNVEQLEISCVGGCGNGSSASFTSAPKPYSASNTVATTVGEWMTTVAQAPAGAEAPAPKTAGSGDWMDKINRDRAAAKSEATQQAAVKADIASTPKASEPARLKKATEPAPAAKVDAKPATPPAVTPVKTAEAKPVVEAKPAIEAEPVIEAKPAIEAKTVAIAEAKPSVSADAKPAASVDPKPVTAESTPALETKPAAAAVEAKPVIAEAKPLPPVETKPVVAEAKPATPSVAKSDIIADVKPATPIAPKTAIPDVKPSAAVETKPAPIVTAKSLPPTETVPAVTVENKPKAAALAPVAPSPAPQQMAALETPKTPAAIPPKTATQDLVAPIAKPEAKAPAPAAVASQKSADVKVTPQETKVAAVEPPAVERPAPVAPAAPKERVISVLSEDKDMNAAIEKARGSLTAFWRSYDAPAPGEADHALKVAVAGNGTTEHFWLTRIKRDGGKLSGVISNQPQSVKSVKVGQRYEFTSDMISDWTFKRNGKLVGNETMRVLLPRMPEEQASVYRQMYETP